MLGAAALAGGCSDGQPQIGTETNWLGTCVADADCGIGECLCSICTLACDAEATCRATPTPSACSTNGPGLQALCGADPPSGICLPACVTDDECGAGLTCLDGSCIPDTLPGSTGGAPGTGGGAGDGGGASGSGQAGSGGQAGGTADCEGLVGPGRPYETIQAAIDGEPEGTNITVCPGTYTENLVFNQDATVYGIGTPYDVVLDAAGAGSTVLVPQGRLAGLDAITIRGGVADYEPAPGVTGGGGIVNLGALVLGSVIVSGNSADYGAGILNLGELGIVGGVIELNQARESGGGLYHGVVPDGSADPTGLTLEGVIMLDNTAVVSGGAIYYESDEDLVIDGGTFTNNAASTGGGVFARGSNLLVVLDAVLSNNQAVDGGRGVSAAGGALYLEALGFEMVGVSVTDSTAPEGAAVMGLSVAGDIDTSGILRNRATGPGPGAGSGIKLVDSMVAFTNVDFGSGDDDNLPETEDVVVDGESFAFGAGTSVGCGAATCE